MLAPGEKRCPSEPEDGVHLVENDEWDYKNVIPRFCMQILKPSSPRCALKAVEAVHSCWTTRCILLSAHLRVVPQNK